MTKTAILYQSPHHGNTKKLLDAIVTAHPDVALIQAGATSFDPAEYDLIGFASGIYMGKFHKAVRKLLDAICGSGQNAFVLYTCGDLSGEKYGTKFLRDVESHGFTPVGSYWCIGHDSVGPLRLIGGIHKSRPNNRDIQNAVAFFETLI